MNLWSRTVAGMRPCLAQPFARFAAVNTARTHAAPQRLFSQSALRPFSHTTWQPFCETARQAFSQTSPRNVTINQLLHGKRRPLRRRSIERKELQGRPQRKAVVVKVSTAKPRKPNSALRKICKVRLSSGKLINCAIPGEGHNVQEHNTVLVRGGRTKDVPGLKYKVIRGKYQANGVEGRLRSRSKYGTKKPIAV